MKFLTLPCVLLLASCTADTQEAYRRLPGPDTGEAATNPMDAQVFADAFLVADTGIVQMDASSPSPDMGLIFMDAEPVYPDAEPVYPDAMMPEDASVPDAGMSSPCPSLMAGDPGVWEWFPQHRTCLYSGINEVRTYSSAEQRCMDLGGFLPSATQLDPFCPDIYFRRGFLNSGQNIWTNVWVTNRQNAGHKLWADSGFNQWNVTCDPGGPTYRCGLQQYKQNCVLVSAWSYDSTARTFACLKRIP